MPEVRRVDLCATVLALHAWGHADPSRFGWYEAPEPAALDAAERLLVLLGALDGAGGSITPLGRRLLDVPAHPRLGRLLIEPAASGLPPRRGRARGPALGEGHPRPELRPRGPARGPRRVRRPGPPRPPRRGRAGEVRARPPRPGDRPGRRPAGGQGPRRPPPGRPPPARSGPGEVRTRRGRPPPAHPAGLSRPGGPPPRGRRVDRRDGRRPGGPARPRVGRPRRRVLPRARPEGGPSRRDAGGPGPDRQRHPARMARGTLPRGDPPRAVGPSSTRSGGGSSGSRRLSYRDLPLREDRNAPGRTRGGRQGPRRGPRRLKAGRSSSATRRPGALARPARPRPHGRCPTATGRPSSRRTGPT